MNDNIYEKLGYSLIKQEEIPEIKYLGITTANQKEKYNTYELVHKQSKAKILFLENNDPEMAFSISFKTPPKDNTGVFHILEHSVLCGSRKFNTKEPFTNLLKSSMQTFLNAMTFDDKTMYPVASTNEKDLYNLIDVYMDAIFFPNIYINKNIFYQESGHKTADLVDKKYKIGFNGVVYNEMKGVYSDQESVMFSHLQSNLLPNTCYSFSSGGIPDNIKDLNYQDFLYEHAKHYRLDNSYIILYGNLNFNKILEFLDKQYLSKWNEMVSWRKKSIENCENLQPRNIQQNNKSISELKTYTMNTDSDSSIFGCAYCVEKDLNKLLAINAVLYGLTDSNDSPLKQRLLEKNLGDEIIIGLFEEINQPFIYVEIKGIKQNKAHIAKKTIRKCIEDMLASDSYLEHISASIDNLEYKYKENLPSYSTGIDHAINIMGYWLYNDTINTEILKYNSHVSSLKEKIKTNYFEKLIKEMFINNTHTSSVEIIPNNNLEEHKSIFISENEAIEIINNCKQLQEQQNKPDSFENIKSIPTMDISDIDTIVEYPTPKKIKYKNFQIFKYNVNTNGIIYANRYYNCNQILYEDIPYLQILTLLITNLNTSKYNSNQLTVHIKKYFGDLDIKLCTYEDYNNINKYSLMLKISCSVLEKNTSYLCDFIEELITNTSYTDIEKIQTILLQYKVSLETSFIQMGHTASIRRALSNILPSSLIIEKYQGVNFYLFLKNLIKNFDKEKYNLIKKLQIISSKIFSYNPIISYAGSNKYYEEFIDCVKIKETYKNNIAIKIPTLRKQNENIIIPSMVNYVALCGDFRTTNHTKFTAAQIVTSKICTYDYLWNEVRIKNGAYGAGLNINNKGTIMFYSFRDPNSISTVNTYNLFPNWLKNNPLTNFELKNYIISCISSIDSPKKIKEIMQIVDTNIFSNIKFNLRSQIRSNILNTTKEDIIKSAKEIEKAQNDFVICIIGNKSISKTANNFKTLDIFN